MIQIDMPMPKCCDECFALDDHGDYPFCLISEDQRGYNFNTRQNRMPSCPLKAQEPRMMTISDFKDEGVYYLEALPPFVLRPVIYRLDESDPRHYNFVWKYDQFTWNTDEYGKTWRCWTSRPTDEQREKEPWNG